MKNSATLIIPVKKTQVFFISFISFLLFTVNSYAQTTYNGTGYTISYYPSDYSDIDYSTYGSSTNCGYQMSDWTNDKVIKLGPGNLTVNLSLPTTYIAFDYAAMDNGETISLVSVNGGGTVSFSTPTSGTPGCITLSTSTMLSSNIGGAGGRVIITSTSPFTQIVFSIGGPYQVMKVNSFTPTLPLIFLDFTARQKNNDILLDWTTALEQNTLDFVIEQSINDGKWKTIGIVLAKGNNSASSSVYQFIHTQPETGNSRYRILQRDMDGNNSYSKILSVNYQVSENLLTLYPNPVTNGTLIVQLPQPETIAVYNHEGKMILTKKMVAGINRLELLSLPKGVYFIKTGNSKKSFVIQ